MLRSEPQVPRLLLLEAFVVLIFVRVGIGCLPSLLIRKRKLLHRSRTVRSIQQVASAVAIAGRALGGVSCLVEALGLAAMMNRFGHTAVLRIGARKAPGLQAHAWVEQGGAIICGDRRDLNQYVPFKNNR